jgi:hypothetical protein
MSEAAESLLRLTAKVEGAATALARARFGEFAEAAAALEAADMEALRKAGELREDSEALAACRGLRRSLDRLGGLLGHVAGVQHALQALDPDAGGGRGKFVREEA